MMGTVPSYHERRHAQRDVLLAQLKADEARERLDREIRAARRHLRGLLRVREALGA